MSTGGRARRDAPGSPGATSLGDTLAVPRTGRLDAPEPGALRLLARAIVDLALALEHEDEEDERWTR